MNAASDPLARPQRLALVAAVPGLAAAAVLAWLDPRGLPAACRFVAFAVLAPAAGSLMMLLIHRMTGGQWGHALRPYLRAGVGLLPWIWLVAAPVLLFTPQPKPAPALSDPASLAAYNAPAMLILRAVLYAVVFFALWLGVRRDAARRRAWLGPVGFIGLVFALHLLAMDWLGSLDPRWPSTAFPAVWMTGQAVSGLAFAIIVALCAGASPAADGGAGRPLGIDWGNLLLATTLMWVYVAFAQFLIIWSGNLTAEITWFVQRSRGPWLAVVIALAVFHFFLPFLFLLSRRFKRFPAGLGGAAAILLFSQLAYIAWVVLPAFAPPSALTVGLDLALLAGTAALLANRYLAVARRLARDLVA